MILGYDTNSNHTEILSKIDKKLSEDEHNTSEFKPQIHENICLGTKPLQLKQKSLLLQG